jgi:hypothetical protein
LKTAPAAHRVADGDLLFGQRRFGGPAGWTRIIYDAENSPEFV